MYFKALIDIVFPYSVFSIGRKNYFMIYVMVILLTVFSSYITMTFRYFL